MIICKARNWVFLVYLYFFLFESLRPRRNFRTFPISQNDRSQSHPRHFSCQALGRAMFSHMPRTPNSSWGLQTETSVVRHVKFLEIQCMGKKTKMTSASLSISSLKLHGTKSALTNSSHFFAAVNCVPEACSTQHIQTIYTAMLWQGNESLP